MAEYTILQVKRDSTLNWYASNPRLALGEPGVDMDLHRFKIGNGIDRWNELPYMDDDLYRLLDEQEQKTADYVQDLLNKMAANKLDADQKYNTVTSELRNTSRDLIGRMTAVEDGQAEYQENLTERQQEFEEALIGDFEDTKSEVQSGLDEFNETRDSLTVRMNVIAGQATEDTEILDARVDAESYVHSNLGENIRNIHSEVLSAKQAGVEETAARIAEYDAEKAERIAADEVEKAERIAADEVEKAERISSDERHDAEIARLLDSEDKLSEYDEFLQEQTDDNAEAGLIAQEQLFREIQRHRDTERKLEQEKQVREQTDTALNEALRAEAQRILELENETSRKDTALSENIAQLSENITQEKQTREQANDELSAEFEQEHQERIAEDDRLSRRISELSDVVADEAEKLRQETAERQQTNDELIDWNTHADARTSELGEFLQEQTNENAAGLFTMQVLLSGEIERLRDESTRLDEETESRKQKDIEITEALTREAETRSQADVELKAVQQEYYREFLSEQEDRRSTDARLETELSVVDDKHSECEEKLAESIQENTASTREKLLKRADFLQEQTDDLAELVVSEMLQNRENLRVVQEDIELEARTRSKIDAQIRESIAEFDEAHSLQEAKLQEHIEDSISSTREKISETTEFLQEQADELAGVVVAEAIERRKDKQELRQEISSETLERVKDTDSVREQHKADVSRLENADSVGAKIRHDEDSGLQEQINELADLRIRDALKDYKERLQAKADKQHENTRQQAEKEYQTDQINDLADGVLGVILYVCQACRKLRTHIKLIENALVDWGVLDEDDIPPMTETEIDEMIEDIFSGNTSEGAIEPDDEDEAEFLEDIYNIFNP